MNDKAPWNERQFNKAMREAKYKSLGHGCWQHEHTRRKFYAWNYNDKTKTENWREWAEARLTPPPF